MNSFGTVGDTPIPIRLAVWPTCCYLKEEYPDDPFFTYLAELHLISFNAPTWTYRCDSWGCFPCEPSLVKSLWGLHGFPQVSDVHLWIICTTLYDFQVCLSDFGLGIWPPQPFPPVPVTDLFGLWRNHPEHNSLNVENFDRAFEEFPPNAKCKWWIVDPSWWNELHWKSLQQIILSVSHPVPSHNLLNC